MRQTRIRVFRPLPALSCFVIRLRIEADRYGFDAVTFISRVVFGTPAAG